MCYAIYVGIFFLPVSSLTLSQLKSNCCIELSSTKRSIFLIIVVTCRNVNRGQTYIAISGDHQSDQVCFHAMQPGYLSARLQIYPYPIKHVSVVTKFSGVSPPHPLTISGPNSFWLFTFNCSNRFTILVCFLLDYVIGLSSHFIVLGTNSLFLFKS